MSRVRSSLASDRSLLLSKIFPLSLLTRKQWLLTGLILAASLADTATTLWGLRLGLVEQNPVMARLLDTSWIAFILFKAFYPLMIFIFAVWLSDRVDRSRNFWLFIGVAHPAVLAYIMIAVYTSAATHNIIQLANLFQRTG